MSREFQWQGVDNMLARIEVYKRNVVFAVRQVALYWSAVFESYAKENAPWTDRTGNARQSLHTWVEESPNMVRLYLSGGVDYQIALETLYAGRFSIIWPTIQRHLPEIQKMLQGIFR